jgi:hypothetical protein
MFLWSFNTTTEGWNVSYRRVSYNHCTYQCVPKSQTFLDWYNVVRKSKHILTEPVIKSKIQIEMTPTVQSGIAEEQLLCKNSIFFSLCNMFPINNIMFLWSFNTTTEGWNVSYRRVSYNHSTYLCTHNPFLVDVCNLHRNYKAKLFVYVNIKCE